MLLAHIYHHVVRLHGVYLFKLLVLERKLRDMNNMMNVKEEKLKGRHRDTHAAIQWLRQNRQLFEGNVHEPMMLVVSQPCGSFYSKKELE